MAGAGRVGRFIRMVSSSCPVTLDSLDTPSAAIFCFLFNILARLFSDAVISLILPPLAPITPTSNPRTSNLSTNKAETVIVVVCRSS